MSSSRILSVAARTTTRAPISRQTPAVFFSRPLSQTAARSLKETHSGDPKPEEFDKHKQDSVNKAKSGKGHWKPELASNSEESIKADRMGPGEAGEAAMRRLQDRTKEAAEEVSKHGTSMRDGL
ncbi:hypothetical protein B0H66DRAFT_325557 [Apodospora peruviana]|uniref:Mitochondrial carrier protein pet8 n=1 Tax=Apodospora peruviana TaxID=516989 RepID=A0AAE0HXY5_9PEZI|nr:hypothetical protein B0H66DRAFT_325557 [Apodospora peruviana]